MPPYRTPSKVIDPRILDYTYNTRQRTRIEACIKFGSIAEAARQLGLFPENLARVVRQAEDRMADSLAKDVGTVQASARMESAPRNRLGFYASKVSTQYGEEGEIQREWYQEKPESNQDLGGIGAGPERDGGKGYRVKGVSTLFDGAGNQRAQWVKTQVTNEEFEIAYEEWLRTLASTVEGLAPITPPPAHVTSDLLSVYAMGDPHFGMYSWAEETGDDFDLTIAERLTNNVVDRLVASSPPSGTALFIQAGDMFHADDSSNQTPASKHALDVDTRYAKVIQVGLNAMVYCIRRMLEKHEKVIAWMVPGNHDPHSSFALAIGLSAWFRNEPRVIIDMSPSLYRYMLFGKVLIGAHHGHGAKQQDLPLVMAVDRPQDWGASTVRYMYMGHIHHDSVKEVQGVRVESIRTLAGKDAWHAGKGYRSHRDMRVIVHHADHGEIERHTCAASNFI